MKEDTKQTLLIIFFGLYMILALTICNSLGIY